MPNVIAAIVGASVLGVAFAGSMIAGLIKSGSSTQQLRWVLLLAMTLVGATLYASVALDQPYVDRPNDDAPGGVHSVLWGIPAAHVLFVPLGVAILTLGLFQSLGARILPVATAAFIFGALALGVFLDNFDKWFWYDLLHPFQFSYFLYRSFFVLHGCGGPLAVYTARAVRHEIDAHLDLGDFLALYVRKNYRKKLHTLASRHMEFAVCSDTSESQERPYSVE